MILYGESVLFVRGVNADRTTTAQQQVLKAFIIDRRHGPSKKHTKIPVCKALAIASMLERPESNSV